jgi:hypothetical protein
VRTRHQFNETRYQFNETRHQFMRFADSVMNLNDGRIQAAVKLLWGPIQVRKPVWFPPFFFPCCVLSIIVLTFLIGYPVLGHNWDPASPVRDILYSKLYLLFKNLWQYHGGQKNLCTFCSPYQNWNRIIIGRVFLWRVKAKNSGSQFGFWMCTKSIL